MGSPFSSRSEVCTLTRRLALRMGMRRAVLVGCVDAELVGGLAAELDITGIDTAERLAGPRLLLPDGDFIEHPLDDCADVPIAGSDLESSIVLIGGPLVQRLQPGDRLARLLRTAPAVLCVEPETPATLGDGVELLRRRSQRCTKLALSVVWRGFVRARGELVRSRPVAAIAAPDDGRLRYLLDTGPGLILDADVDLLWDADAPATRSARVCLASYEFIGPTRNGGIGTATTSLARALAAAGHSVTAVFTGWQDASEVAANRRWRRQYKSWGIELEVLAPEAEPVVICPHFNARRSHQLYRWLRDRHDSEPFDVIQFPECQGHAYYSLLAKRHGLAFDDATMVVGAHSPTRWIREANRQPFELFEDATDDFLERRSVELADVVVSPSAYMLDWMIERGWALPERSYVQQYVRPDASAAPADAGRTRADISELVFFGRLEVRKGIVLLCDALDLLTGRKDLPPDLSITFLGKPTPIDGLPADAYIEQRAARWPWAHQLLPDKDHEEAIQYLRERPCLALMPSTVDNSPNTIAEAISLGIPLLAATTGGTAELIDVDDLPAVGFDPFDGETGVYPVTHDTTPPLPAADALADAIVAALTAPPHSARAAIDPARNRRAHVDWHAAMAAGRAPRASCSTDSTITVCMVALGSSASTRRALAAYEAQTKSGVELIAIVGGTERIAGRELARHGWRCVPTRARPLAAALNEATTRAAGEWILFTTTAHVPTPQQLETLRRIAGRTDSEAVALTLSCGGRRGMRSRGFDGVLPIGGPVLLGIFFQCFGGYPVLVRRETVEAVGGFPTDASGNEVHTLLAAVATAGATIDVAPDALAYVEDDMSDDPRRSFTVGSMRRGGDPSAWIAALRPYHRMSHGPLGDLPSLAHGAWAGSGGWRAHLEEKCASLERHRDEIERHRDELERHCEALERHAEASARTRAELEQRLDELGERFSRQRTQLFATDRQMRALRDSIEFIRVQAGGNGASQAARARRVSRRWRSWGSR